MPNTDSQSIKKDNARIFFTSKFIRPKTYLKFFRRFYKSSPDWLDFDPGTIWMDIQKTFKVEPSDNVRDKINAMKTSLTTEAFFSDWVFFEKVILAFNDMMVVPGMLQASSPAELGYGLVVAREILTPQHFDEDIYDYIRASCKTDGLLIYPSPFKFAQPTYDDANALAKKVISELKSGKITSAMAKNQESRLADVNDYITQRLRKEKEVIGTW